MAGASPLLFVAALAAGAQEPAPAYPFELRPFDAVRGHLVEGWFKEPLGVCFDPVGRELLVADSKNDLIGIFDSDGLPLFTFGGSPQLVDPKAVAVRSDGDVFVLDSEQDRIKAFSYRGEPREPLRFDYPATEEHPAGTARVGAFAIDREGRFYVGDLDLPQLLVYDRDLSFVRAIRNERGAARFGVITGVAVSDEGLIAVVDYEGTPVQVFDPEGRFLSGFGERDIGTENFTAPFDVEFDEDGFLYVVDMLRHDVKIFDTAGGFHGLFGGWFSPESGGRAPGELLYPTGVTIAPGGFVYVAERFGQRVQLFERHPRSERRGPRLRLPAVRGGGG